MSAEFPRLVADVGGTHVRFASQLLADGPLQARAVGGELLESRLTVGEDVLEGGIRQARVGHPGPAA